MKKKKAKSGQKKQGGSPGESLVPVAQAPAPPPELKQGYWKWTKDKRKAVRLLFKGVSQAKVARLCGVHRHTVKSWLDNGEFRAAIQARAEGHIEEKSYRRVYETGVLADALRSLAVTQMQRVAPQNRGVYTKGKKKGELKEVSHTDMSLLQTALREYREFRGHERQDFGHDIKRVEGVLKIGMGSQQQVAGENRASAKSFTSFIAENLDAIDSQALEDAAKSGNALGVVAAMTRNLLTNTTLLDQLQTEDKDE